ncbi:hypothetical protein GCM10027346_35840 [Hymenobacter seoulensis]
MRFSAVRFLLPVLVACLASCSESSTKTEKPAATAPAATTDSLGTAPAPTPKAEVAADTSTTQAVAAYLAGLPSSHKSVQELTAQPAWQAYATDADKSWTTYHSSRTAKIESWAQSELAAVQKASPVIFYPFSGPDFLNATTMFPESSTYVLIGLEPVGTLPSQEALANPKLFTELKGSLWSVLNFSFFRTNDMAVNLKSVELDGALPLLMLFAARTNHQVAAVRYVQLSPAGEILDADTALIRKPGPKVIPGVELKLKTKEGQEKKLVYFSADLSDWKLGTTKEAALTYVRNLGPLTTYVKSATYLMHKPYFSKVRNLILERSNYVLQDDSGIAMKYFQPTDWQFTFYGTYKRPINLFAKFYQPALTTAYLDSVSKPRPLPFGTGYNWRQNDSNLLLAQRASLLQE